MLLSWRPELLWKRDHGSLSDRPSRHRLDSFHSSNSCTRFYCGRSVASRRARRPWHRSVRRGSHSIRRLETVCTDLTKEAAIQPRTFRWRSPRSRHDFCDTETRGASKVASRVSVQRRNQRAPTVSRAAAAASRRRIPAASSRPTASPSRTAPGSPSRSGSADHSPSPAIRRATESPSPGPPP